MPEKPDGSKMIRFDFPPGAGPEEIAAAIREAGYKLLPEKVKAEQEKNQMTLDEATELAQQQADEFGVAMIVVRDDLCEDDPGGFQCCAELYRDALYPDVHQEYWEIVGRVVPR